MEVYIYLAVYILFLLGISFFISKKEDKEDFLISGRNRGFFTIMASKYAGSMGISWFITYAGFAYIYGLSVFSLILGFIIGYFLFAFWVVPKFYEKSKKNKYYTQGDLVYNETKSKLTKKITNIFSSLVQFVWLLVSIVGGAKVISSLGYFSYESGLLITIISLGVYIILSGYRGVIATDIIQSFIMIFFFFIITYSIFSFDILSKVLEVETSGISVGTLIGFFLYGIFSFLALSDRHQLMFASKTKKDAILGISLTFIPMCLTGVFIIFIGLFVLLNNPNLSPDLVFIEAVTNYIPESLFSLGIVLLFAGLMSSADTYIYAIASHLVLKKTPGVFDKIKKDNRVLNIRKTIVGVLLVTLIVGLLFRDIIGLTVLAAGLSVILSMPIIYLTFGGKSNYRFLGSFFSGIIGLFIGILAFGLTPTIVLSVLLFGALGLLFNMKKI